jgi:hypothetical protein
MLGNSRMPIDAPFDVLAAVSSKNMMNQGDQLVIIGIHSGNSPVAFVR